MSKLRLQSEVSDVVDVVGYARVSTEDQDTAPQSAAIAAECERRGWRLVAVYEDVASGSTTNRRPGLADALAAVESGVASTLVVAKVDRLARSLHDFTGLVERSRKKGWRLVALDLGVDTATPSGELLVHTLASFAHFERRLIGQRTAEALAVIKQTGTASGKPIGRPRRKISDTILNRMLRLRAEGMSQTEIAATLNAERLLHDGRPWHQVQVSRVLARAGEERPGWDAVHQPKPVDRVLPDCDREGCTRRAVARWHGERLCKRHHEAALKAAS